MRIKNSLTVWMVMFIGCFIFVAALMGNLSAVAEVDFAIKDIRVETDGFITIQLENRSHVDAMVTPERLEKIFLTIYINKLKRAEYKLKYFDEALLKKQGRTLFRTNFRVPATLEMSVEINLFKVFPETNFSNNRLVKVVAPRSQ